jgi:FdhD protein
MRRDNAWRSAPDLPDPPATESAFLRVAACRLGAAGCRDIIESVAVEMPVARVYNGLSHAVMLATPQDLEDFALGFSLSEGILRHPGELAEIEIVEDAAGIELRLSIDRLRFARLSRRRRNLAGRTGCGICGLDSLEAVLRPLPALAPAPAPDLQSVRRALAALPEGQRINRETRSLHAAAWADGEGRIRLLREDVGRHNALDKLIGAMARERIDPKGGFALITSRCSVEMVQKAATFAIPCLVAISAPTTLAISQAAEAGLQLIALARSDSLTVYRPGSSILEALA